SAAEANEGLHALWNLDADGDITVHGAAVIRRDNDGQIEVATKDSDPGIRTVIGVGIGMLLGALAVPIGAAAGASIAAGAAIGLGAAVGGAVGLKAAYESRFVLPRGKSAVIAEVAEPDLTPVDLLVQRLGGIVFRRTKGDLRKDEWFDTDYTDYLYPYDYEPTFA
ncbi:MAG TPA: hypothetical protein VGD50_03195, partial [Candidatus Baltobacteraceae bacterium]